ncbi:uncharacterized protein J7T54_006351 [Emericellopsis cladophorae]|uniref:Uncharacterized protein n=1 Tax=Emericellopsis cladophorae TaxID=2686198 RepID=A0A9P9Y9I9_9HYPO|nr:uncharacterized protein J7T54_006351 [Emericellopsis cladophorae]KAI6786012.1 hypothetical protein J7T54_006351 [Emericellopsis cladophorae]
MPASYAVYKLKSHLAMQDPDMPSPRFHTVIFVETTAQGGVKYHVTGDIVQGMHYESEACHYPLTSETLHSKELLGYTSASDFSTKFENLLKTLPPPPKQKAFNTKTLKTEPVKSWNPVTFYEPGEARTPLRKCTEWTEQQAIPALQKAGLIWS